MAPWYVCLPGSPSNRARMSPLFFRTISWGLHGVLSALWISGLGRGCRRWVLPWFSLWRHLLHVCRHLQANLCCTIILSLNQHHSLIRILCFFNNLKQRTMGTTYSVSRQDTKCLGIEIPFHPAQTLCLKSSFLNSAGACILFGRYEDDVSGLSEEI